MSVRSSLNRRLSSWHSTPCARPAQRKGGADMKGSCEGERCGGEVRQQISRVDDTHAQWRGAAGVVLCRSRRCVSRALQLFDIVSAQHERRPRATAARDGGAHVRRLSDSHPPTGVSAQCSELYDPCECLSSLAAPPVTRPLLASPPLRHTHATVSPPPEITGTASDGRGAALDRGVGRRTRTRTRTHRHTHRHRHRHRHRHTQIDR